MVTEKSAMGRLLLRCMGMLRAVIVGIRGAKIPSIGMRLYRIMLKLFKKDGLITQILLGTK